MEDATPYRAASGRSPIRSGRDELNLAEFPLAAISDYVPDGQKTLVFEDTIWDQGRAEAITRRLTISASDAYGLPTALDDEVILGLIQLTKECRFAGRQVAFTRYQLIQLLGWRDDGRSYDRIEQSLKRWLGVTLYYDKAWWDNASQSWANQNFHILEQVTFYDAAPCRRNKQKVKAEAAHSSFTWNEVVFRSFQAGYLKQLDLDLYRTLRSAVAKRMYRFLDKRFFHRDRWELDLVEFACEHIGLGRNYDTAQLKRRLDGAIEELEAVGFLEPMARAKRYVKVSRGDWRIVLERREQSEKETAANVNEVGGFEQMLVQRGVTLSVASELVRKFPSDEISSRLEVLDWLVARKDAKVSKNPAGYLVKSILERFTAPKAFERASRSKSPVQASKNRDSEVQTPKADASLVSKGENPGTRAAIDQYWATLSAPEQRSLEQSAVDPKNWTAV